MDPQTQTPVKDGPRLAKWEKKLRSNCARMDAKFVSYKPDGGVWRFEVGVDGGQVVCTVSARVSM